MPPDARYAARVSPDDFDLLDPRVQADPWEAYDVLRAQAPVYEMPGTGFVVVTSHAAVTEVAGDPETWAARLGDTRRVDLFRSQRARDLLAERGFAVGSPLVDGPDAGALRDLLARALDGAAERAAPFARAIALDGLLTLGPRGECEFVSAFCVPLWLTLTADRLGLPLADLPRLKAWSEAWVRPFGYGLGEEQDLALAGEIAALQQYLLAQLAERRASPRRDVLSALATARLAGGRGLDDALLLGVVEPLLVGALEPGVAALGSCLLLLLRHPEAAAALRADPARIPDFVDEALRLESPVQSRMRRATRDTELCGAKIPKDRLVDLRLGAANRDPAVFPEPQRLDLARPADGVRLAFGPDGSVCPGATLARTQLVATLDVLLEHWTSIERLEPDAPPAYVPSYTTRSLHELPIRYQAVD